MTYKSLKQNFPIYLIISLSHINFDSYGSILSSQKVHVVHDFMVNDSVISDISMGNESSLCG